jgi:hypothetical protein
MKNPSKILMPILLIALLLIAIPLTLLAADPLEGKIFVTLLDGDNDLLSFQNGMFHSSSCDEWGFGKGAYTTEETGDAISFRATTTSAKDGSMVWTGTVQGRSIKGSYLWTKEGWFGTKSKTKNFAGSLK